MTWMRGVSEQAKDVIIRLLREGPWRMNDAERLVFARWAVMHSMTYEFADVRTLVTSQDERDQLRQSLAPPSDWAVCIAAYSGEEWREMHCHRTFRVFSPGEVMPDSANGQSNVYTIGRTAVWVVSGRVVEALKDLASFASRHSLFVVWPMIDTDSLGVIGDQGLQLLATLTPGADVRDN